ncbi:MAG: pyrroline-5-carboxylate reductase [Verrucomicrobiales bacterium]|jgi:pyrroline-5-carboxylate reductase|nr:pyrroline-5-carboxylate reductase [Verrucomicrobiales bacterium]
MQCKLSVIGTGKMGTAIIKGLLDQRILSASDITGADASDQARQAFLALDPHGALHWAATPAAAVRDADVALLAVKPQNMAELLPQLRAANDRTLFISIAAGITLARLEAALGADRPMFRVMPNTPLMVGEGVTACAANGRVAASHHEILQAIFGVTGRVFTVSEPQLDAVTALSGSGPAFFALIADRFAQAAVAEGLPAALALPMALQTMRGTAALLTVSGMTPEQLITQVSSKGGTTVAGLEVLRNGALADLLAATISAAANRSRELSKV